MLVVHGKVMKLLQPLDEGNGNIKFSFFPEEEEVEYDSRHHIICSGKIPYIMPGMPLELELIHKLGIKYQVVNAKIITSKKSYSQYFLGNIKGISVKTANKLLEDLDNDIGNLLRKEDPETYLSKIPGSSRYRDQLLSALRNAFSRENIYDELSTMGFDFNQIVKLEKIYGTEALEILKQKPYEAASKAGVDFYRADFLARKYKHNRFSVQRMKAIVWELLLKNESNGNTRILIKDFISRYYQLLKSSAWPWVISPVYLFAVMHTMSGVLIKDKYVCVKKRFYQEQGIVRHLERIAFAQPEMEISDADIEGTEVRTGIKYLESQKNVLRAIGHEGLLLMPGKPGTGKTTTIRGVVDLFRKKRPEAEICLCAPTARAAQAMKEASGHPASTIHLLVGIVPYGGDFLGKNEADPLLCDLLIVDEMSMVDTETFYLLVRAVKNGCQVILSGDPDQLESVGCGSVFRSLLNSGRFKTVVQSEYMRQDEKSSIIENCRRVLKGNPNLVNDENFRIFFYDNNLEARKSLGDLFPKKADKMQNQILSTTKQHEIGTVELNRYLEQANGEKSVRFHNVDYKVGDKVVFEETDYGRGYCNGDIGIIVDIENKVRIKLGDRILELEKYDLQMIQQATAMSIHKSQGSEYENVFIMLPEEPRILLNRNILNTAISRARKKVFLFTVNNALNIAVANVMKRERNTWLPDLLKGDEIGE